MDLSRPKVPVVITFSVPGTQPPVYVASSLTNPAWDPLEMSLKEGRTPSGDLVFEKSFDAVESGEYQYKFRLGPGDWWVCDENAPIVSDDAGNRNNLLIVKPLKSPTVEKHEASSMHSTSSAPEAAAEDPPIAEALKDGEGIALSNHVKSDSETATPIPAVVLEKTDDRPVHGDDLGANSSQGQKEAHEKRAADAEPDEVIVSGDVQEPAAPVDFAAAEDQCPLLPHEKLDLEPESDEAPLLPHERSASVSSEDDEEAVSSADFAPVEFDGDTPLFRHESISLSSPDSPPRSPSHPHSRSHTSLKDIMAEEDLNDPSLEPFPTRRDTIIEHIQGLANRLEEDRSVPEDSSVSSPHWSDSRSSSSDHLPPPSPLDSIQEDQELEVEDTEQLPQSTPAEPSSEQSAPAVPVGAVPTPPLTPKDEERGSTRLDRADSVVTVTAQEHTKDDKGATHDTDGSKDTPRSSDLEASEQQQQQPTHLQPSSASITDVDRPATPRSTRITPERKHSSFLINFWNSLFGSWLGPVVRWFSRVCGGKGRATVLAVTIGVVVAAYSYQSTLLDARSPAAGNE